MATTTMGSTRDVALNLGLLVLRTGAGLALATHGYPKLFGGEGKQPHRIASKLLGKNFPATFEHGGTERFGQGLEQMGVPYPRVAAHLTGLTEFGGGLALAFGLGTRLVTPAIVFNMCVAIGKAHWSNGFHGQGGFEMPSLFAVMAAALCLTGPGDFSLDALIDTQDVLPFPLS
ncbi:MAG TPA: DoxX family protein [Thermomicrobiaceae bacterium]|nr:DoxX family protein [Thermomicrobiaceae bacterium]